MIQPSLELEAVERSRIAALVNGDLDAAASMHADDFHFVSLMGSTLTKEQYFRALAAGHIRYIRWDPGVMMARVNGDVGTLRYRADLENVIGGAASTRQDVWQTQLYERRDGRWRVVWSQATECRQPRA